MQCEVNLCDSAKFRVPRTLVLFFGVIPVGVNSKVRFAAYMKNIVIFIGASLSEPHTSVTALRTCVCMLACLLGCLLAAIYRKF